jgi:predicted lipid-binding transport protein (Tim44 family)
MRTRGAATAGKLTVVLATLVLVVAGCGGPSPRVWAASVCEALTPWRAEINKLTSSTQQQMTAQTTPAQAKENLVRLFAGAEQASETARRRIEEAGVPETDGGAEISAGFRDQLSKVRDAYGRARATIDRLDTGRADAFYDGVRAAVDTLNKEYDESALDTSRLNSTELKKAFDEVPECR